MKTFEEKYTAWVDGKLSGSERAAFEREVSFADHAAADKVAANRLGDLLREHLDMPLMSHADFFNHQLAQRIAGEAPREGGRPAARGFAWTLPRLAWAGACSLLVAAALYFSAVPSTQRQAVAGQEYVANILNAHTDDPAISATAYHDKEQNVTVLWLDGLDYIPVEKPLK